MKKEAHYEGRNLVLMPGVCNCEHCDVTIFEEDGPRCVRCGHLLPIIAVGVNDQEGFDDYWRDEDGNMIRNDEVLHT